MNDEATNKILAKLAMDCAVCAEMLQLAVDGEAPRTPASDDVARRHETENHAEFMRIGRCC